MYTINIHHEHRWQIWNKFSPHVWIYHWDMNQLIYGTRALLCLHLTCQKAGVVLIVTLCHIMSSKRDGVRNITWYATRILWHTKITSLVWEIVRKLDLVLFELHHQTSGHNFAKIITNVTMSWQSYGLRKAFFFGGSNSYHTLWWSCRLFVEWSAWEFDDLYMCRSAYLTRCGYTTIGNCFAHFLKIHFRI